MIQHLWALILCFDEFFFKLLSHGATLFVCLIESQTPALLTVSEVGPTPRRVTLLLLLEHQRRQQVALLLGWFCCAAAFE